MDFVRKILATNPILFTRAIASVAALAVAFGIEIGDDQVNAAVDSVLQLVAIGNMILAFVDRAAVFSPKTHAEELEQARKAGVREGYAAVHGDYL